MDHQSAVDQKLTERYILGELDASQSAEFEEHFFGCAACAKDIRQASLLVDNLKAVLSEDAGVQAIEIEPGDKFVDMSIGLKATPKSLIDCEFRFANATVPMVVTAAASEGSINLQLPTSRLTAGVCTVILRDRNSRGELGRRQLVISRSS